MADILSSEALAPLQPLAAMLTSLGTAFYTYAIWQKATHEETVARRLMMSTGPSTGEQF
jgi:hypothetical protein